MHNSILPRRDLAARDRTLGIDANYPNIKTESLICGHRTIFGVIWSALYAAAAKKRYLAGGILSEVKACSACFLAQTGIREPGIFDIS